MHVPKVGDFESCRAYIEAFISQNPTPAYSQRALARRLKWPLSYLNEVLKGKRPLTLRRAVEFSEFVGFDSFDAERFLLLNLRESDDPHVRRHFDSLLARNADPGKKQENAPSPKVFEDIELLALFSLLKWYGKLPTTDQIKALLFTFHELTEASIADMVRCLQERKLIDILPDGSVRPLVQRLVLDSENANDTLVHSKHAENFLRYIRRKKGPAFYNSGFIQLPTARFPEILARVMVLRNWLLEVSRETAEGNTLSPRERLVFQFDINIFPILDRQIAADLENERER